MLRVIIVTSFLIFSAESAKILCVFTIPSVSHQIIYQPIWKELSVRGHQVTVITTNPLKDPSLTNLTEIDVNKLYDTYAKRILKVMTNVRDHWSWANMVLQFPLIEEVLQFDVVKNLINDKNKYFDVVLAEYVYAGNSVFGAIYGCPIIAIAPLNAMNEMHRFVGNPTHPVSYPDLYTNYGDPPTFLERVDSFIFNIWMTYYFEYLLMPSIDKIIKRHVGENVPYIGDTERNVSMMFINTSPILHKPRPLSHTTIEMGGLHIKPKKPLPDELKSYLDNAKEGVIYFSLGSNVKSVNLDKSRIHLIISTFAELPYKIMWKYENNTLPNKPANVKTSKWFPQQDVFGHPNVKLFITQGGLQSLEEAIYNDMPLLALPFFADQDANARRISSLGIGRYLNFHTMTKNEFKETIIDVLNNQSYKENIMKIHTLLTDRPMTGLGSVIWWTEYVIRHKGAPHFQSPLTQLSWTQYLMIDVIAFIIALVSLVVCVLYKFAKFVHGIVFPAKLKVP